MIHRNPTRRRFLTATAGAAWHASAQSSKRPNILFLLTDDQRWDALGCMANRIIHTPVIDRLAAEGVTFLNNFCATAICMTSRACIFTGQHERTHGISAFNQSLSPEAFSRTYPALLRKAGYRTGFIGKYGLGGELPASEFDYFKGFPGQGRYEQVKDGKPIHLTDLQGDQAIEFLENSSPEKPFCLSISFKAPHVQDEEKDPGRFHFAPRFEGLYKDDAIPIPKTARERYFDAMPAFLQNSEGHIRWKMEFSTPEDYQRSVKGYYRLITGVDVVVGRILDSLEKQKLLDNTVIIFTSDNGFFLGERELSGKWLMHEESIRTPLIIRDPRLPAAMRGKRRREMTLNVDVAPTILSVAGIAPSPFMQGRDLSPLVRGQSPTWRRDFYYSHLFDHKIIPKSEGIRNGRFKYIRYIESKPLYEALYDLHDDPLEEENLAQVGGYVSQMAAMRERCKVWRSAVEGWRPGAKWREPAISF
jgi:arylsulfatase A-like enzyme